MRHHPFACPTGALGTYRSFLSSSPAARRTTALLAQPIAAPTLAFFGADDGAMDAAALARTAAFFTGPYDDRVLPGVGHFVHREAPDRVLPVIRDFLRG